MQIRVAEEKMRQALVEIYSYYVEKTAITFEYETPSTEEFVERIHNIKKNIHILWQKRTERNPGLCLWLCLSSRGAYGWCAEMSIYVKHDRRGDGAGGRLYRALESLLAEMGSAEPECVYCRWHRKKMNI